MWQISQCVGEMATFLPLEGGFLMWPTRFVNKQFGAATHYNCEFSDANEVFKAPNGQAEECIMQCKTITQL